MRLQKDRAKRQSGSGTGEEALADSAARKQSSEYRIHAMVVYAIYAGKATNWTVKLNDLFFQEDVSFLRYRSMREHFVK